MTEWQEAMRDAAYAANLAGWDGVHGGYLRTGDPYNPWTAQDWATTGGAKKLPIVAMSNPGSVAQAEAAAFAVMQELYDLAAPVGCPVMLDLESAVNGPFVERFGAVLNAYSYEVWPYGSTDTLFSNPQLNGYAVSAPSEDKQPYMYERTGCLIRLTQYALDVDDKYDSSTVKPWTLANVKWWR